MVVQARDREVLAGIARMYALTADQIQERWFPGIAMRTVLRRLQKLAEAGLVTSQKLCHDLPRQYLVTPLGARCIGLDFPVRHALRLDEARHTAVVVDVARYYETAGWEWIPEAVLRQAAGEAARRGKSAPIPDGVATRDGYRVAVEVELTAKPVARMQARLRHLAWSTGGWEEVHVLCARRLVNRTREIAAKFSRVKVMEIPEEAMRYVPER